MLYIVIDIVVFVCVVERRSGCRLYCSAQTLHAWMSWNIVISYSRLMTSAVLRLSIMDFLLLTWSELNYVVNCRYISLPLNLRTDYNSLRPTYSTRTVFSQCHAAPQITVIWLELWRYTNYITYLLTYLVIECLTRSATQKMTQKWQEQLALVNKTFQSLVH